MAARKKIVRQPFHEEDFIRGVFDRHLRNDPLYGHKLCTRARNILIDTMMDDFFLEMQIDKAKEKQEMFGHG